LAILCILIPVMSIRVAIMPILSVGIISGVVVRVIIVPKTSVYLV